MTNWSTWPRRHPGVLPAIELPELATKSSELAFLEEWLEEVSSKRPLSKLEIMQREMEIAIASELYERAAELRDAIKLLQTQSS